MAENKELQSLQDTLIRSEDEFEKKILYIGSGALLLSMTLLDKIVKLDNSTGAGWLVAGWIILVLCLIINLVSHLITKIHIRKTQKEIIKKVRFSLRIINHKKRLCLTESLNWTSTVLLILGICGILIFASLNATNPKKPQNAPIQSQIVTIK